MKSKEFVVYLSVVNALAIVSAILLDFFFVICRDHYDFIKRKMKNVSMKCM